MVKPGFVAGTTYMTLADISFMATYSTLKAIGKFMENEISIFIIFFLKLSYIEPMYVPYVQCLQIVTFQIVMKHY